MSDTKKEKKKLEFSQKMLVVTFICCIIWVSASFVLAFLGKDVNQTVTVSIVTTLLGGMVSYHIYQSKLKTSRDKYRNGNGHENGN